MCAGGLIGRLNRNGMAACGQGRYDEAASLLGQAVVIAGSLGLTMFEAKLRNNLGLVMLLKGDPAGAADNFTRARTGVAARIGTDNHLHARIERNLAAVRAARTNETRR
jgi:Flp pilus assembly protein TadD